jgi:ABC-type ATPase with predicted acetyltransferase domain
MKIRVRNKTKDFDSYRSQRVKSLFNAETGSEFNLDAEINCGDDWEIGLIVGASGTGKTSIGRELFGGGRIVDLYDGWDSSKPIIDEIGEGADFNDVTGSLSSVGLGDVPSWLRPFSALSNGQQFRAGLTRLLMSDETDVIVDEFTSVIDRQIAKIGAQAFQKSWRRQKKKRRIVLLSCHYDIIEWLQPDWYFDTATGETKKGASSEKDPNLNSKYTGSVAITGDILNTIII